jgi:hypothetical protein
VLDVSFREDACRIRDRHAARVFAVLRKIAMNLIRQDAKSRASLKGRRSGWNDACSIGLICITRPRGGLGRVMRARPFATVAPAFHLGTGAPHLSVENRRQKAVDYPINCNCLKLSTVRRL